VAAAFLRNPESLDWLTGSPKQQRKELQRGNCVPYWLSERLNAANERGNSMKYGLMWLLGVPIPLLIVLYFIFN
jgi:hypothetical protein